MNDLQELLHTLNSVTAVLLETENGENTDASILKSMELMGRCVSVDRVHIWQNEVIDGALYFVNKMGWLSDTGKQKAPVHIGLKIPYSVVPEWERVFLRGEYINSPLFELPPKDQDFLSGYEIKSIVIIPLFIKDQFWGFFSLEDCREGRVFTADEISVLRSAGLLLANALRHSNLSVHEALERLEVFWSNVECGISVIDAETRRIIDINPVAVQMFGADKAEIVGRRCHKFLCPADECSCPIMDKNQIVDRSERKFIKANGETIPIIKSVAKVMLNGRLALLESFTDISNLKDAEEKIRLMEITEQANKAKTDFLSRMSHEMRTPMNAIIGMTAIGKSARDMERKDYALTKIEDASILLLGIINDVLDMAKIESGKFELSLEEFNFEKILQRVVGVVSFRMDEKKQDFTLYIDNDIPPVLIGDNQRLMQVITNLLGNAVKFTPNEGFIRLNSRLLKEEDSVCTIQVEVTDSGIGISAEQQTRIFRSFQQAENNTTRKYGGSGLGLSISKNIVEMMGGKIWVESELEHGATFAFTFQMKRGDSQEYERLARVVSWKNIRILAVDDNAGISGYIKNFVEGFGAHCDTAVCGMDVLHLIRQNAAYDLFFIDWKMSDIDGLNLARQIKAIDPDHAKTVVIMLSSVDWHDIEERAREAGVDNFLPKPLFPSAIEDIINEFLGVVQRNVDETAVSIKDNFKGRCVLLAEDIEINREIVLTLLEPTLITIECAENGVQALRMFEDAPDKYDMIFMDVQMPEMNGHEATRRIRALDISRAKDIPIVAMTADVFREDIEKCLEAGMNAHVGKPIDFNEVLAMLRKYLNLQSS